ICTDGKGIPTFDQLHNRRNDHLAFACAFDLLMVGGEDLRHQPYAKRKAALRRLLKADRGGIQYVEHAEGHGDKLFAAACELGLEGIVSKKLDAPYRSGPSKTLIKIKNPKAPAATRAWFLCRLRTHLLIRQTHEWAKTKRRSLCCDELRTLCRSSRCYAGSCLRPWFHRRGVESSRAHQDSRRAIERGRSRAATGIRQDHSESDRSLQVLLRRLRARS